MSVVPIRGQEVCCEDCSVRARYVRDVADLMGMRDWTLEIEHDPAPAGFIATIEIARQRRLARVSFAELLIGLTLPEIRYAVVHELAHTFFQPVFDTVEVTSREQLGGTIHRVFIGQVEREIEASTDIVASALAPHMPLPW